MLIERVSKPRTITVPLEKRVALLEGNEPITALREQGGALEHALLAKKETFLLGSSPSCDIVVPGPYVSSLHCVLERRGQRIRVHDQSTRNGTTFAGRRESTFDIGPGDTFTVATTTLLALSEDMRLARPVFATVLGHDADSAVDDALLAAIRSAQLLVTGEKGSGQPLLVQAIHQASLRRAHALVEFPAPPRAEDRNRLLDQARRGTLVLSVTGERVAGELVADLLSAERNIRLVVLAPSLDTAVKSLGIEAVARLHKIAIRPLRERSGDLATLLDRFFVEHRASLRTSDLTARNQDALRNHAWPENLDELREAAARIAALVTHGSIRKAAPATNMARSTLQYWADRIGLELPLTT